MSPSSASLHSSHHASVFIQTTTSQHKSLGGSIILDNIKLMNILIAVREATAVELPVGGEGSTTAHTNVPTWGSNPNGEGGDVVCNHTSPEADWYVHEIG